MKALFLSVLICLASLQSFADCAGSGIWVSPSTTIALTETPVITIEGYYMDQEMIRNAGKKYTLYLKSENELVRLIPVEILEGEMELTQVLLKPVIALRTDTEYELIAKSITKSFTASTERLDLGIPISVWTVKAINDKTAPLLRVNQNGQNQRLYILAAARQTIWNSPMKPLKQVLVWFEQR
jgi:hypothetical protein